VGVITCPRPLQFIFPFWFKRQESKEDLVTHDETVHVFAIENRLPAIIAGTNAGSFTAAISHNGYLLASCRQEFGLKFLCFRFFHI
jgi:hypothetical protein